MNNDLITMIIIAWDAGVTGANMAIVDRADACGFDMRAVDRHGRSQHRRITFRSAPCATVEKVRRELADLSVSTRKRRRARSCDDDGCWGQFLELSGDENDRPRKLTISPALKIGSWPLRAV